LDRIATSGISCRMSEDCVAAVGFDIGCGMCAVQTSLSAEDLPDVVHTLKQVLCVKG